MKGGYVAAAVIVLLWACGQQGVDDDNFRDDVFGCEEALAHLQDCCPGFVATKVRCRYEYVNRTSSCDGTHEEREERPALEPGESRCIRDMSCSDLVERDVCTRAQNDLPYKRDRYADVRTDNTPVCP